MRFFIPFLLLFGFDLYVYQAFAVVIEDWSATSQLITNLLFWIVPVLIVLFMFLLVYTDTSKWSKRKFTTIRSLFFIAYFSKLVIAGGLLFDDGRRLFLSIYEMFAGFQGYDFGRSETLAQIGITLGVMLFFSLTYGILRNPYRYKIFRETIALDHLPDSLDGLKIVQISDIHSGSFTLKKPVELAIDMINQQKADLVFFTGDLVNSMASEMEHFLDVFNKIQSKHGVFSILGNHDYGDYVRWESKEAKKANFEKLINTHAQMGWDLILNENRILDIDGEKIAVIGVENYSANSRFPKYGNLQKAYEGSEIAALKLLLSHDPTHWEDEVVKTYNDIDITFSGHTHGFQFGFEITGWIKWSPVKYFYKQWAGLYQKEKQYLYVNRGFGFLGYPGRVGILPEITVIEVKKGSLE